MSGKKLLIGALAVGAGYVLGRIEGNKRFRDIVGRTVAHRTDRDYSAWPPYMRHPTTFH